MLVLPRLTTQVSRINNPSFTLLVKNPNRKRKRVYSYKLYLNPYHRKKNERPKIISLM